ncbi:pyridoxamine 5'-phosphate oxidase family protein [Jiangella gansuensis]|uniref:pyridoxamine 5'-phosphate oxidase family protein n=1 Tax=Jiangella gansuensis TaxID=281473 RepID=UPI00047E7980|nr:pyridoxamine 5'-phosphate oxidase family protein [Jiangella gansuensis]
MARQNEIDVDAFLARPLTARVATNGPTVRPAWYLWEDGAFWILTGPWARLADHVRADPALHADPALEGTVWLRLRPDSLAAKDLSYRI